MSGRSKKIVYSVISGALLLAALAGSALIWWFSADRKLWLIIVFAAVVYLLMPLHTLVHEFGHVVFGLLCGMKFISLRVGYFVFERAHGKLRAHISWDTSAGSSTFFPKYEKGLRGRVIATTLGGAIFNFVYAIVFFLLYFLLPHHPALLFFELFATLNLVEGICALIPAELAAGKTDGEVICELAKNEAEAMILLHVLAVQACIYRKSFAEVPQGLLFDVPVVREDYSAWHALLYLRMLYYLRGQDAERAQKVYRMLSDLSEYIPDDEWEEIAHFGEAIEDTLEPIGKSPFYGVRELEEYLIAAKK